MDIECRGGRIAFKDGSVEVENCVKFCRKAVEKLAEMSRRVFHTPEVWVFILDGGVAEIEERLFVDACRVSGSREVIEYLAQHLAEELDINGLTDM